METGPSLHILFNFSCLRQDGGIKWKSCIFQCILIFFNKQHSMRWLFLWFFCTNVQYFMFSEQQWISDWPIWYRLRTLYQLYLITCIYTQKGRMSIFEVYIFGNGYDMGNKFMIILVFLSDVSVIFWRILSKKGPLWIFYLNAYRVSQKEGYRNFES